MKFLKREDGNVLVLVGLAMTAFLLMAGLVLDGASLFMSKRHLQKTANAAALSSAQELTESNKRVNMILNEILEKHQELDSLIDVDVQLDSRIDVSLAKQVPLAFGRLFGKETSEVAVHAAAELAVMGKAIGAAPLGIDDSLVLEYNKTYKLKVDQSEVDTGNFGVLALGGTGAATYEDNLRYGYQDMIKLGDVLDTQTGNIAGKTRTVIDEKINQCPYTSGEAWERDCERILLVPVYKPYLYESGQLKHVIITGFSYFFVTEPMDSKDTSITGMFIKRAGRGTFQQGANDNGAYAIRLTR